jgi:hypothetical protein
MTPDTGQLATAVFDIDGGGDFEARYTMLGELQRTIDKLDASALDTEDEKEYVPGDLIEPGEIENELYFDGEQDLPEPRTKATVTVTYPLAEGQATAASWTASGFFIGKVLPSAQLNTLMKSKVKFALDGRETKFTYTPATAAP